MTTEASPKIKKMYLALCREIDKHNRKYYQEFAPEISDVEYDKLYKKLQAIEAKYPDIIRPFSPTQRIGHEMPKNSGFEKVEHKKPMLSLANTYNGDDIASFHKRPHVLSLPPS